MKTRPYNFVTFILIFCTLMSTSVFAANECKIKYGWNTGNSLQNTFKNHSKKIYLNKGQTKTLNKKRMNYVKNLKTRQVKFYLTNASNVTLNKNQRNPAVGTYVGTPKLVKVKCLNTSTGPSTGPASPAALVQTLKNQNVPVKDIAIQLKTKFNKSYGDIVILLKGGGFNITQIADALDSAFNITPVQLLNALKKGFNNLTRKQATEILQGLNVSIQKTIDAVKTVLGGTLSQIATAMRQAGYTSQSKLNQLSTSLKTKFNAAPKDVVNALVAAGYKIKNILRAIIDAMGFTLKQAVKIMKQAGIPGSDIAQAIVDSGINASEIVVAKAFKFAGWAPKAVMQIIKNVFKLNAKVMVKTFKLADYSADQTTQAVKSVYKLSRTQAEMALKYAGYKANQIIAALNKYYGQAQQAARQTANNLQQRVNTAQQGVGLAAPAVAAAVKELQGWFIKAEIYKRKCKVNAVIATGTPGVFGSSYRWKGLVREALKTAGLSNSVATQWDHAYKKAFLDWARNVTIPGLPWYPAFAAYPSAGNAKLKPAIGKGSIAPPLPNIPAPLGTLVSRFTPGMAAPNLKKTIFSSLGSGANANTRDAASSFATQIGARFVKFLASANVMTVLGSGHVRLAPGSAAGPVVGGSCWGKNVLTASAMTF